MAPLLEVPAVRRAAYGDMGLAFQLTNFIRDVPQDWALDRLYLPREELDRHGVGEDEIARGAATAGFRALLASQTARARTLFADTEPAVAAASPRVQPSIRLARSVYEGVLDRVERIGFDVFGHRASPPPWLWAMGVEDSIRQEIPCMRFTTPKGSVRYRLPWSWSAFDYRELCRLLFAQSDARFETAKVDGRGEAAGDGAITVQTDRGD